MIRLALLTFISACAGAYAQPLTLEDALRGALERDPVFAIDSAGAQHALVEAEQAERGFAGRITLRSTGGRLSRSEFGDKSEATAAASLVLPGASGRSVSVDTRYSFSLTTSRSVEEMYAHDPQVAVTLKQPLVGALPPAAALGRAARGRPAAMRSGALVSLEEARNAAVQRAARLYYTYAEQRQRVALAQTRLAERRAEADNLERGSSLRLGGQREAQRERLSIREDELGLEAARSALARLEPELAQLLGRPPDQIGYEIPVLELDGSVQALRARALVSNPAIRRADSDLATRRADAALAALSDAPVANLGVTLDGDYNTTDTVWRSLGRSVSELRPKVTLSLLMDLPLARGRDRELARSAAAAREAQAAAERSRLDTEVAADISDLAAERGRQAETVALREEQASLARDELRVREGLSAASQATAAEVAAARLDVAERELSLWRARADLFLLDLQTAALAGDDLGRLLLKTSRPAAAPAP